MADLRVCPEVGYGMSEESPLLGMPVEESDSNLEQNMTSRLCPWTTWCATHPKEFSALPIKKKAGMRVILRMEAEFAQAIMSGRYQVPTGLK
ncbi:hypothetical protein KIPB_006332 [Kipferlia bialata]|uniref:Uncharacterized protein n=1 Tax=Kipferlia bialata TaxID=797122 RepID=A0A9K3GIZ7_9EUKA|nr:hypothetical protein KIPB_002731 [Kipferlia bialata]GIQ83951.1 hypothetical protein KIPB_005358 [Kipferlia bialata]GIQ84777.1 hypothetical protein KIPB_006332 [Kipferlia bialata]|eukprot:g2731.t1